MERIKITRLPLTVTIICLIVCALPFVLTLLGVDFSNSQVRLNETKAILGSEDGSVNGMFHAMSGAFTHTILEWSAFCCAIFVAILALSNYIITKNVTVAVIGVALFCSGCVDAFHALAADRLIHGVTESTNLVPFTWAISRVFNAVIIIFGVSFFLFRKKEDFVIQHIDKKKKGVLVLLSMSVFLGCVAYIVINVCATSENLPQTMSSDAMIKRPWDIIPLVLFCIAGFIIYPLFYKKHKSIFAFSLILSAVPEIVTEMHMHMAFGSTALFDSHFNIAHFLKIMAYGIPLIGLIFDYIYSYKEKLVLIDILKKSQKKLEKEQLHLDKSNEKLQQFTLVASHDLKAPLMNLSSLISIIGDQDGIKKTSQDVFEKINISISRMRSTMDKLDEVICSGQNLNLPRESVKISEVYQEVIDGIETMMPDIDLDLMANFSEADLVQFPKVHLVYIMQNLITNSLKYREPTRKLKIQITTVKIKNGTLLSVQDNGRGIDLKKFNDKLFGLFQRFHLDIEGSGIGLHITRNIVEIYGGYINLESEVDKGTKFNILITNKDA